MVTALVLFIFHYTTFQEINEQINSVCAAVRIVSFNCLILDILYDCYDDYMINLQLMDVTIDFEISEEPHLTAMCGHNSWIR